MRGRTYPEVNYLGTNFSFQIQQTKKVRRIERFVLLSKLAFFSLLLLNAYINYFGMNSFRDEWFGDKLFLSDPTNQKSKEKRKVCATQQACFFPCYCSNYINVSDDYCPLDKKNLGTKDTHQFMTFYLSLNRINKSIDTPKNR